MCLLCTKKKKLYLTSFSIILLVSTFYELSMQPISLFSYVSSIYAQLYLKLSHLKQLSAKEQLSFFPKCQTIPLICRVLLTSCVFMASFMVCFLVLWPFSVLLCYLRISTSVNIPFFCGCVFPNFLPLYLHESHKFTYYMSAMDLRTLLSLRREQMDVN